MVKIDTKSLLHLERYLSVLVNTYPQPIRASILAEKTQSSKPAITKIRERLMQICDLKTFALERGFVLSFDSNVLINLFLVFAANKHHRQFLSSRFVQAFFNSKRIHSVLVSNFPLYNKYFSEDDTKLLLDIILNNIATINPEEFRFLMKTISMHPSSFTESAIWLNLQKIISKFQFTIKNENELYQIFSIRDKFFFLIRDSLWLFIENMKILESIGQEERSVYIAVYKNTIDFYLRRIFEALNEPISLAAAKSSLRIGRLSMIGSTVFQGG